MSSHQDSPKVPEQAVYDAAVAFVKELDPLAAGDRFDAEVSALVGDGMPQALKAALPYLSEAGDEGWITCPGCGAEGEVGTEPAEGGRFVADSGKECPLCKGAMGFEDRIALGRAIQALVANHIPVSALLSDESVEALARSTWNVNGRLKGDPDWSSTYPHDRDTWIAEARRDLEAVVGQFGGSNV